MKALLLKSANEVRKNSQSGRILVINTLMAGTKISCYVALPSTYCRSQTTYLSGLGPELSVDTCADNWEANICAIASHLSESPDHD